MHGPACLLACLPPLPSPPFRPPPPTFLGHLPTSTFLSVPFTHLHPPTWAIHPPPPTSTHLRWPSTLLHPPPWAIHLVYLRMTMVACVQSLTMVPCVIVCVFVPYAAPSSCSPPLTQAYVTNCTSSMMSGTTCGALGCSFGYIGNPSGSITCTNGVISGALTGCSGE